MKQFTDQESKEILHSAISMTWLRPESGLALASFAIHGKSLNSFVGKNSLDMACGDGSSTFFRMGGRFSFDFDIYQMGTKKKISHQKIAEYNIDVFDSFDTKLTPRIKKNTDKKFTFGVDHKINLLSKANTLNIYKNVVQSDLAQMLPMADESLDLCYCNSIYWVENPIIPIKEMLRVLKPSGVLILELLTTEKINLSFSKLFSNIGENWAKLLDRGRINNNPGLKTMIQWEKIFKQVNLEIVEIHDIFPYILYQIYNVGFRPIFPLLQELVDYIPDERQLSYKKEWVDNFVDLLHPLLISTDNICTSKSIRIQYALRKK